LAASRSTCSACHNALRILSNLLAQQKKDILYSDLDNAKIRAIDADVAKLSIYLGQLEESGSDEFVKTAECIW
jgi:hypothetical protein